MSGENLLCSNISFEPALTNKVARVSIPVITPASLTYGSTAAAERGLTIFDAAKTSLNTLKAEKVYGATAKAAKAVKSTAGKITFAQALKRFRFSGKCKIIGLVAAAGLVTASAIGLDN